MTRSIHTPDCGFHDCTRAAYRGGLCRKHWYAIPFDLRLQQRLWFTRQQLDLTNMYHVRMIRIAEQLAP